MCVSVRERERERDGRREREDVKQKKTRPKTTSMNALRQAAVGDILMFH